MVVSLDPVASPVGNLISAHHRRPLGDIPGCQIGVSFSKYPHLPKVVDCTSLPHGHGRKMTRLRRYGHLQFLAGPILSLAAVCALIFGCSRGAASPPPPHRKTKDFHTVLRRPKEENQCKHLQLLICRPPFSFPTSAVKVLAFFAGYPLSDFDILLGNGGEATSVQLLASSDTISLP